MKNRIRLFLCLCVGFVSMFSASGCQLAMEEDSSYEEGKQDRLVGIFVTTENVHEKIYAKLTEVEEYGITTHKYVFEECEGIPFFSVVIEGKMTGMEDYATVMSGDEIFDQHTAYNYTDKGDSVTLEGNMYFAEGVTIYINGVYQEKDGDVYLFPAEIGEYIDNGIECNSKVSEEYNGEETAVNVNFSVVGEPETIDLIGMNEKNESVWHETYKAGEVPEKFVVSDDVQYIMAVTNYSGDYNPKIDIYYGDDTLIVTAKKGDGNVLTQNLVELIWE